MYLSFIALLEKAMAMFSVFNEKVLTPIGKLPLFEKTKAANKRLFFRVLMFAGLTVISFVALEYLVANSKSAQLDGLVLKYPEILGMLRAATILTFLELLILVGRIISQPKVDVQKSVSVAEKEPMASAVLYVTHSVNWMVRVYVFLLLCGFI